ncbi:30S ribosomal protein S20 [Patescibacteria group bacterium]|nr:30S ribosomal protein S20 [Patescibacteria group bacterium]
MPIIKRAIKKLRHDRARTIQNTKSKNTLKMVVIKARKTPTEKSISEAARALDKAVKKHLIHKNAAARTKSRLAKLLAK